MIQDNSIFKDILEVTTEGMWIIDKDKKTTYVNNALCKMLGYSKDELIGKEPFEFVDEKNTAIFNEQCSQIETTKNRTYAIELQGKNGRISRLSLWQQLFIILNFKDYTPLQW